MGEFADYTLDEVMDAEDDRLEYRTEYMPVGEAYDKGIIDELGFEFDPLHPNGRCTCCGKGRCGWCKRKRI